MDKRNEDRQYGPEQTNKRDPIRSASWAAADTQGAGWVLWGMASEEATDPMGETVLHDDVVWSDCGLGWGTASWRPGHRFACGPSRERQPYRLLRARL
jgi:hypothetical protein